jgi:ankyrin repeat protein
MKRVLLAIMLSGVSLNAADALIDAVRLSDHQRVSDLLSGKVNVDAAAADGMTALHVAALRDDTESARLLLQAHANASVANSYGVTPLWLACRNGNAALVDMLMAAGADPKDRLHGEQTVLMMAARAGSLKAVKALAERGADINAKDNRGQTAVMWAAAEGHADVVEWLIQSGADFRMPLRGGFTPLFFAIREGRSEAVKVLLEAGSDVNEAMDPERRASRGPQSGMTPLLMAVENGHFELAIDLARAGADPNDRRAGYAVLHAISWVRKPDHGEGENGMPPPDGSGALTSLDFVREIVSLGADVNIRIDKAKGGLGVLDQTGATPFLLAAKTADIELLQLLHDLGADPSIPTEDRVTPLIAAAGLGTLAAGEVAGTDEEVLEALAWLLEIGLDVNAVDKNGETAMHAAAYKNLPGVVEFLAENGAEIEVWNQPDKYGWTPLLIAEGFRPGNFKPSFETIASIHKAMLAAGVTPPPPTSAEGVNNSDFGPRERKYLPKDAWKKDIP